MRTPVKDNNSRLIGYIVDKPDGTQVVEDKNSRLVGYVTDGGTFDHNRRRVSTSQVPGLLLGC